MTKEETLDMIIDDYKNGSQSAMRDYCNGTRCDDCQFDFNDCMNDVTKTLTERLLKTEGHQETNLEHYIVRSGVHITKEHDIEIWEFRFKKGTEKQFFDADCASICDWLLSPYEEPKPNKLSKFEHDLLECYHSGYAIKDFWQLEKMVDKGYFKGVPTNARIEDILDNCEVID